MSLKNRITAAASRALYSAFNFAGVQIPPIQYDFVNYEGKDVYSRDAAKLEAYYSNAYRACMLAKARPLAALPVHVYDRDGGVRKPKIFCGPSGTRSCLRRNASAGST